MRDFKLTLPHAKQMITAATKPRGYGAEESKTNTQVSSLVVKYPLFSLLILSAAAAGFESVHHILFITWPLAYMTNHNVVLLLSCSIHQRYRFHLPISVVLPQCPLIQCFLLVSIPLLPSSKMFPFHKNNLFSALNKFKHQELFGFRTTPQKQ